MDITKLIEREQALLATREATLRDTLEELTYLETLTGKDGIDVAAAIGKLRVKRDRQNHACESSKQTIRALELARKKAK